MHRATPLNTSIRAYTAGGARSVVDKVDDSKQMQEMGGSFMANESRSGVEAPQNYGFSSVVFDAEKGKDGKVSGSAETFVSFMGGNRSFPVAGNMDDRRHRMSGLKQGDSAMFRGRGDKQQFHMTEDGGFWSGPQNKTLRMQLVASDSESNSTQGGGGAGGGGGSAGVAALDGSSSGGGASGGGQQQQKKGQQPLYKDGQKSAMFIDVTKDKTRMSGKEVHAMLEDGKTYLHVASDKNVYLGGSSGDGQFAKLVTLDGPCSNSQGKIG